jgi:biopolymer transport protein ExbB
MQTEFGLANLWSQGDTVTRTVALLLLAMSMASWLVIILKTLRLWSLRSLAAQGNAFWQGKGFTEGLQALQVTAQSPLAQMAAEAHNAAAHHRNSTGSLEHGLSLSDWVSRAIKNSIDDSTDQLQSGLAVLASVGSTAPFVGLFGTVWGIYHALLTIGASGQATIDKVAGPVGEALIMTALGLAVAIPAVLGYNALVRGNKAVLVRINRFAHDLHAYLVTGSRISAQKNI